MTRSTAIVALMLWDGRRLVTHRAMPAPALRRFGFDRGPEGLRLPP